MSFLSNIIFYNNQEAKRIPPKSGPEPAINCLPVTGQWRTVKKDVTSLGFTPEPAIQSRDSGQRITFFDTVNRLFPSSPGPLYQNEVRCSTFLVEMSFICMRMKNHFHIKG